MTQLWPVTLNSPCLDVLWLGQVVSANYKDPQAPMGQPLLVDHVITRRIFI